MQKLQLSIPEPCHENWQQMTPTDQGRFCNACAKEVVDFSTMTDIQVLNYFTNLSHEKVCGRALPEQLDRSISYPERPGKKLFWYWNYIVMFFMFFGKGNSAKAQGGIKPVTEMNPVKPNDVRGEIAPVNFGKTISHKITGKITDIHGNPVSFASVLIKGTATGTNADANGAYSIKVNPNAILVISGASFKDAEVLVGTQTVFNTVMEKGGIDIKEVVVTVAMGGIRRTPRCGTSAVKTILVNSKIVFEVKEDNTGLPIDNAAITITPKGTNLSDKSFSDKKGIYEFKQIKLNGSYFVKVEAAGYEPNEFTIDGTNLKEREKAWEILLKKQKVTNTERNNVSGNDAIACKVAGVQVKLPHVGKTGTQNTIRLGGITAVDKSTEPIYVVDGVIRNSSNVDINPDDIEDITILQTPQAMAIYGIQASNGAIVITTRKAKEISLKEVVVNSGELITCSRTAGGISYTNIYDDSLLGDTIATVKTILTESIKVYPNPIQRGYDFSVALKLKQPGKNYSLLITDASGKILWQQKFNASAKDHTEKISGDKGWAAGVYYIRIFDTQNKLVSKSSFVFQ